LEPFRDLPIRKNLTISQAHRRLGLALLEAWKDDAGKARLKEELKKQQEKEEEDREALAMEMIPESVAESSSRPTTPGAMDENLPRRYKDEAIENHRRMRRDSIISMKGVISKLKKSLKKEL
jgi:hypothetical protein